MAKKFQMHFILLLLMSLSPRAFAVEIYSFVTKGCQIHEGVMIRFENENIELLTLAGDFLQIAQDDVQSVLIHNVVENPITQVRLTPAHINRLKSVSLYNEDRPRFVGWPVKFVEDLVVFFDISGKTHVVEMGQISKIRPAPKNVSSVLTMKGQSTQLAIGDLNTSCPAIAKRSQGLRPSRILSNQIQIEEALSSFEKGFRSVSGHEERTYFYARPMLYDISTRAGFFYHPVTVELPSSPVPIFFRWGSGKPFRYQSSYFIGGGYSDWIPNLDPVAMLSSEVKSHLFHATVVMHLPSIAAGSSYFDQFKNQSGTPVAKGTSVTQQTIYGPEEKSVVMHAFNYMALMGFDLGGWSFSGGPFFPLVMFAAQGNYREVLSNNMGPTLRLMYTTKYARLRLVASTASNSSSSPSHKTLYMNAFTDKDPAVYTVRSFSSKFDYLRAGLDYEFASEFKTSIDALIVQTRYDEVATNLRSNFVDHKSQSVQLKIAKRFGDYVVLGANYTWHKLDTQFDFVGKDSDARTTGLVGGFFEFIF